MGIYIITPPPKVKGSLQKREGIKTSKEPEVMDKHKETASFIYSAANIH